MIFAWDIEGSIRLSRKYSMVLIMLYENLKKPKLFTPVIEFFPVQCPQEMFIVGTFHVQNKNNCYY